MQSTHVTNPWSMALLYNCIVNTYDGFMVKVRLGKLLGILVYFALKLGVYYETSHMHTGDST